MEWHGHKPRNTGRDQKLEEARTSRGSTVVPTAWFWPSDTDFALWPLELWENRFLLFKPSCFGLCYSCHGKLMHSPIMPTRRNSLEDTTIKFLLTIEINTLASLNFYLPPFLIWNSYPWSWVSPTSILQISLDWLSFRYLLFCWSKATENGPDCVKQESIPGSTWGNR